MKYIVLLVLLGVGGVVGALNANVVVDFITSPLSWNDREVARHLAKPEVQRVVIAGVPFKSLNVRGKQIYRPETIEKIRNKWKGSDYAEVVKIYFGIDTPNSILTKGAK